MTETVDTAIIGSGVTGLMVARELVDAGREATVIERGSLRIDADQLPIPEREPRIRSTEHNTGPSPRRGGHPWMYGYAFGGSSLLWSGVAPRLLPSDFEMRSRYGVWRDWPISYDDLLPFYRDAERLMKISGGPHELFPGSDAYPVAPRAPSSIDRVLGPLLEPFGPLAQARPQGEYPPRLDSDREPVEQSFTMLDIARDLIDAEAFRVRDRLVAARLRSHGDRVIAVECLSADGGHSEIRANRVVLATHGIENAALLLRSGLGGGSVGRWLGDHPHVRVSLRLSNPIEQWDAEARDTGISYAWADGPWRSERASAVVIPFNPGVLLRSLVVRGLVRGRSGVKLRNSLSQEFRRCPVVYVSLEDAPREDRFVELSSRKDRLGLPRTRVSYPADSDYAKRGLDAVLRGLEERLRPLGARVVATAPGGRGGHMVGTCFMGADGVVDENLRHHDLSNLYIGGSSAFPTHSALHPTTTIAALAIRLGRHLASEP